MEKLTEEVLDMIFSYIRMPRQASFEERTNMRILHSLSLSCKSLSHAASRALYHTIDIEALYRRESINLLFRTLFERPQTAKLIYQLSSHDDDVVGLLDRELFEDDDDRLAPPSEDLLARLLSAVDKLPISSSLKEALKPELQAGFKSAQLALLIGMVYGENLTFLGLTTPTESETDYPVMVLLDLVPPLLSSDEIDLGLHNTVTHLTEVDLRHVDQGPDSPNSFDFYTLLRIPTLHSLKGRYIFLSDQDESEFPPDMRSNVQHIALDCSSIERSLWVDLFASCFQLRSFSIIWPEWLLEYVDELEYPAMGKALRRHAPHITDLIVNTRHYESINDHARIGSLVKLTSLANLEIPLAGLIGNDMMSKAYAGLFQDGSGTAIEGCPSLVDILPISLRSLGISETETDHGLDRWLFAELLLLMTDERFKNLTAIHVDREGPIPDRAIASGWEDIGEVRHKSYGVRRQIST